MAPPLPLAFSLAALKATRDFHATPAVARPWLLRRVYLARVAAYALALGGTLLGSLPSSSSSLRASLDSQTLV